MSLPVLQLKKRADKRLRQGHLWVYSNEVDIAVTPLKDRQPGEQVVLKSADGKLLGTAFVQPGALICGRVISRDHSQKMDRSLMIHRLNIALSLRRGLFSDQCYRLVFGDSDGLPGVVVDRFKNILVVQISSAGMEALREELVEALVKVCKPDTVLLKNNGKMRQVENLPSYVEVAYGKPAGEALLVENGVQFLAPIEGGQKTGWFYDHRLARSRLGDYVEGKRVLDVFSYVGGWGVQAAAMGAESVTCVDSSDLALEYVMKNAALNAVDSKVSVLKGDAFEQCRQLREAREKFDVVIIDPPAFIPRKKDQKAGEQAYQRINQIAMRLLAKDGLLVSCSCSMHLSRAGLIDIVRHNARTLDRFAQLLEQHGQGGDHPIVPAIPETEYLKSLFVRLIPSQ